MKSKITGWVVFMISLCATWFSAISAVHAQPPSKCYPGLDCPCDLPRAGETITPSESAQRLIITGEGVDAVDEAARRLGKSLSPDEEAKFAIAYLYLHDIVVWRMMQKGVSKHSHSEYQNAVKTLVKGRTVCQIVELAKEEVNGEIARGGWLREYSSWEDLLQEQLQTDQWRTGWNKMPTD